MSVQAFVTTFRTDLAPTPGRLRSAVEMAVLTTLTVVICMEMGVPEAALSCYLIFFSRRDNQGEALKTALMLLGAATFLIPVAFPLLQLAVNSQMARLAMIGAFTFVGMVLAHGSKGGSLAGTGAFIFAFVMTLYDIIPVPDLLTRAITWMWVVIAVPMLLVALWAGIGMPSPRSKAEELIAERRRLLTAPRSPRAQALLDEGMTRMDGYLKMSRLLGHARGADAARLAAEADGSYLALAQAAAGCPLPYRPTPEAPPPDKEGFLAHDFFTSPAHIRFGFKVLAAVMLTYGLYTAGGHFEIHTAMITCYFVALGTQAETHHKMTLRLIGCIIGAVLGVLVVAFAMPHMTDIGHLAIIVFLGAFLSAWVSLGSDHIAYAGWQMALCFFLIILAGTGPVLSPAAAFYRVLGIVIGIAAVWGVFQVLWPVSAKDEVRTQLDRFDALLKTETAPLTSGRAIARLRAPVAEARRLAFYLPFEAHHPSVMNDAVTETEARLRGHICREQEARCHA